MADVREAMIARDDTDNGAEPASSSGRTNMAAGRAAVCIACHSTGGDGVKCTVCELGCCTHCARPICPACQVTDAERSRQEALDQGLARERRIQVQGAEFVQQLRLAHLQRYRHDLNDVEPFMRTMAAADARRQRHCPTDPMAGKHRH